MPDHVGRSFSPLGLGGILILDLGNGISGFANSNQHSLGEMNTFFVAFRDLVPRRAVPRTGMINESGFDGACYDDKGVFWHLGLPLLSAKHIRLSRIESIAVGRGRCPAWVINGPFNRDFRFCLDTVAKVENRTIPKISQKPSFRRLYRCNAL
jgi:hypothetical protein